MLRSSASPRRSRRSHGASPRDTTSRSTSTSTHADELGRERRSRAVPDPPRGDRAGGAARARRRGSRSRSRDAERRRRRARRRRRRPARAAQRRARGARRAGRDAERRASAPRSATRAARRSASTCRRPPRVVRIGQHGRERRSGFLFFVWSTAGYQLDRARRRPASTRAEVEDGESSATRVHEARAVAAAGRPLRPARHLAILAQGLQASPLTRSARSGRRARPRTCP